MKLNGNKILYIDRGTKISTIDWTLGNYCNFQCSYCFPGANTGTDRVPSLDSVMKRNLTYLVKEIKSIGKEDILFHFSGGEPTLYHDIVNLMKFLRPLGSIAFVSNGSRTVRWWKQNVELMDNILFSYHSEYTDLKHLVNVCDTLMGKVKLAVHIMVNPKLFDKCIEDYKSLATMFLGEPISFQFKLLRENRRSIVYTKEQQEIMEYWSNHFPPNPTAKVGITRPWSRIKVDGKEFQLKPKHIKDLEGDFTGYKCYAHHDFLQINKKGELGKMSCSQKYTTISSIYSENFIDTFTLTKDNVICEQKICGCLGLLFAGKEL